MRVVGYILIIIAVSLLTVNLYGLTQDLEPKNLNEQHLRFGEKDRLLDAQAFWLESIRKNKENDADYAERLTKAVAGRIAAAERRAILRAPRRRLPVARRRERQREAVDASLPSGRVELGTVRDISRTEGGTLDTTVTSEEVTLEEETRTTSLIT